MKAFVFLFRMDITTKNAQPSAGQMETYMTQWMKWIHDIDHNGQLLEGGNHFSRNGRVIYSDNKVTEGPYTSAKNSVAGYILVQAKNLDAATRLAEKCPILEGQNTSVEIRELATPGA
ncbi:MAG: transcription initiation protein [Bacteroidetes bacterium]|nr:transcription initiation protein [Bacteroidota bacterium]